MLSIAAQCIAIGPVCGGRTGGRRAGGVCDGRAGGRAGGACYHDNSKLRASILTKLCLYKGSDYFQLIKFWPPSAAGRKLLAPPYYTASAQCLRRL